MDYFIVILSAALGLSQTPIRVITDKHTPGKGVGVLPTFCGEGVDPMT